MNMEQANMIPLSFILEFLNRQPVKQKGNDIWYHSPFREERTASFHINTVKNIWFDFGEAKGGDIIDLVCHYLYLQGEDHTGADALRWLRNMKPATNTSPVKLQTEVSLEGASAISLRRVSNLKSTSLINYLEARGITSSLAKRHVREASVYNRNTGKYFSAICLRNECDGYELRSKFFKGCVAPKGISFIRGSKLTPSEINIFEGFIDFLSLLEEKKVNRLEGDSIILNSTYCLPMAFPYIENYTYTVVNSWLDNDPTGENAAETLKNFVQRQGKITFKTMNTLYAGHKDINAWHMHKKGLRPV